MRPRDNFRRHGRMVPVNPGDLMLFGVRQDFRTASDQRQRDRGVDRPNIQKGLVNDNYFFL